jgi:hypothetical protein
MIGNDGEFGSSQARDDKVSLNRRVMEVPGTASVISLTRSESNRRTATFFVDCS